MDRQDGDGDGFIVVQEAVRHIEVEIDGRVLAAGVVGGPAEGAGFGVEGKGFVRVFDLVGRGDGVAAQEGGVGQRVAVRVGGIEDHLQQASLLDGGSVRLGQGLAVGGDGRDLGRMDRRDLDRHGLEGAQAAVRNDEHEIEGAGLAARVGRGPGEGAGCRVKGVGGLRVFHVPGGGNLGPVQVGGVGEVFAVRVVCVDLDGQGASLRDDRLVGRGQGRAVGRDGVHHGQVAHLAAEDAAPQGGGVQGAVVIRVQVEPDVLDEPGG